MINSSMTTTELRLLLPETMWLEPEDFELASQLSQQVSGKSHQWQTYLNVLALAGFRQWLQERFEDLPVNQDNCSVLQPQTANALDAVCHLRVGEFKLCLTATENILNEVVTIPRAAVDLSEFATHFYVVLEVEAEQEQLIIRGFLRYDQLVNYRQSVNLQPEPDGYQLPLSLFDAEPDHLPFYCRHLELSAIPLPVASAKPSLTQAEREALVSNLPSSEQRLWQTLTWEQQAVVLSSPELLDLLYQWQMQPARRTSLGMRFREALTFLSQQAVNTALWLRGEMDELASRVWQPLPPLTFAVSAMRQLPAQDNKYQAIARELKRTKGLNIPPEARGSCQQIDLEGTALELCAVTWSLAAPSPEQAEEWALLLILAAQPGHRLPPESRLRVSDPNGVVSEPVLENEPYLHACVAARRDEQLVVTIALPNGASLTLPDFAFNPGQLS